MPAGRPSRRTGSALAPAGFAFPGAGPVAAALLALALAVAPGSAAAEEPAPAPAPPSRTPAYIALGAGAALTVASFVVAEQADRDYERYLAETDPARLDEAYDAARRKDRLAAGTLIAGQAALAFGIYWRFLRRPRAAALESAGPRWGVAPRVGPAGAGIAVDVRF